MEESVASWLPVNDKKTYTYEMRKMAPESRKKEQTDEIVESVAAKVDVESTTVTLIDLTD